MEQDPFHFCTSCNLVTGFIHPGKMKCDLIFINYLKKKWQVLKQEHGIINRIIKFLKYFTDLQHLLFSILPTDYFQLKHFSAN